MSTSSVSAKARPSGCVSRSGVKNADQAPGIKRGGTVNIVTHTVEVRCSADAIPEAIEVDISGLDISYSKHLSDVDLPASVKPLIHADATLVTIVPPSGYAEEMKAAAEAAAAATLLRLRLHRPRLRRPVCRARRAACCRRRQESGRGQEVVRPSARCATRLSNRRTAKPCASRVVRLPAHEDFRSMRLFCRAR